MNKITDYVPVISPLLGVFGTIGAFIASLYGGWTDGMTALLIFMGIDYITGIIVAVVFKKSKKSENGGIDSRAGFKGLCRKGMILLVVLIGALLDRVIGTNIIRDAVVLAFIANETVSIIENAGLMGVPIPSVIRKAIDILHDKSDPEIKE